ncbi:MAG: GTP 3',8-cyclase MoaA [Oscillibacter sp.]|jgi:cyclic pyranopterin phosphate synthase|nr:GTP 3',8-cyclase MoaA [Oscillibacter sp.]
MLDRHNRNITYLRLSVTDRCSLRCRYCMPADGIPKRDHRDVCSAEELVEIARAAVDCGVRKVRLTGGEPLVRRGILEICRGIAAIPGVEELCLTTNGAALARLAKPLREAGVSRLNISLDTLRPERYAYMTRVGRLEDVFRGLEAAEEAGFTGTKLNVVLMKGFNDDEIPDFLDLSCRYPVEVRFIELMPIGEGRNAQFLPAEAVLDACPCLQPLEGSGVARRYRSPGGRGTVGLIEPMSHRFCAACDRIRVTADGKLKPCLHSRQEISLRGLSGEALRLAIEAGIAAKPERHYMNETGRSEAGRRMNQIGG